MVQGNISSWKKKEGESFGPGDVLAEIETDKVPVITNTILTAAPSAACKSATRRSGLAACTVDRQSRAEACTSLLQTGAGAGYKLTTLASVALLVTVSKRCYALLNSRKQG